MAVEESGPRPAKGTFMAAQEHTGIKTEYTVRPPAQPPVPPARAVAEAEPAAGPVAIFVTHGMGQQIPFQTLDRVTEGLRRQLPGEHKPTVSNVLIGTDQVQRAELEWQGGDGRPHAVHVYEAYWAPLTEGKVTLRDVIAFLYRAGLHGLVNARDGFLRYLFGEYTKFHSPIRLAFYLLVALATMTALVLLNSTIVLVSAARSPLQAPPAWLGAGFFADLTTTFDFLILTMIAFALSLAGSMGLSRLHAARRLRLAWGAVSVLSFVVTLFAILAAGVVVPLLFFERARCNLTQEVEIWTKIFPAECVRSFDDFVEVNLLRVLVAVAALVLLWFGYKVLRALAQEFSGKDGPSVKAGRWFTVVVVAFFALLVGGVAWELDVFRGFCQALAAAPVAPSWVWLRHGLPWVLVIVASAFIRRCLIEYAGDVAAYVDAHKLDRFTEVRQAIKDCVTKAARLVYSAPEGYRKVLLVGHSLGSVVNYDVLNRLIDDDELAGQASPQYHNVVRRTPLFLTFGSPLDKTAFLFALQRNRTTEAREALAATVQPLIQNYQFRPRRWINFYSRWDIFSGHLDFYDPPGTAFAANPQRIDNRKDPDATTLFAAHNEYWDNPSIFKALIDEITR